MTWALPDGRSLAKGVAWLAPYLADKGAWLKQVKRFNLTATGPGAAQAGAGGGRGGGRGGRGGGAPAVTEPAANATARQVTYTVNVEVDRKALRAQVFNEGWRIMKNRFYDPKMHGADWNATKAAYEPLLDYLVDDEELNTVMMMMIGQPNAPPGVRSGGGPVRLLQDHSHLQGRPCRSRLPEDQKGRLPHLSRRPRPEDKRELLAVLHPRGRQQVPLHGERQAGQRGRLAGDDCSGCRRRLYRFAVRQVGHGSTRDGHEVEQRRDRLPPHSGDGSFSSTSPPSARRRRSSSTSASMAAAASIRSCSASSPAASISTRSVVMRASSSRGRRTSTARWW